MTYAVDGRQFVVIASGGHPFIYPRPGDYLTAFALPPGTESSLMSADQPDPAGETVGTLADRLLLVSGVTLFAIGQSLNFIIVFPMSRAAGLT